ncbi:hypothetical protein [Sorangium sp. So ce406]|uniref:hypothetical protein n=1 Tax=Sorangium sp. So ce406 TaxID=3133311 RepID=UPI003F5C3421
MTEHIDSGGLSPGGRPWVASALTIAALAGLTACEPVLHGGGAGSGGSGGSPGASSSGVTDGAGGSGGDGGAPGSGGDGGAPGSGGDGGAPGPGGDGGAPGPGGGPGTGGAPDTGGGSSSTGGGGSPGTCVPGSVVACYTGPAGTNGVGRCASGTQTCRPDGFGYSPCTGEVTPARELCATPEDENCDGEPHCAQPPPWARGLGGPGADVGWSIASDAYGNYYVAGSFTRTVDFGTGPLTSAGGSDIFLVKLDAAGSVLWSQRFGSKADEDGAVLTVDENGNVLLAGRYYLASPGLDLHGCLLPSDGSAFFVAQFDPDGNHIWSRGPYAGLELYSVQQIAVDDHGDVYVVYRQWGDGYLVKIDAASKEILWTRRLPGIYVIGAEIALDSAGNAVAAVWNIGSSPEADPPNPSTDVATSFIIAKYAPTGDLLWSRDFQSTLGPVLGGSVTAIAVATNAEDEILVTGKTDGSIDFGGGILPAGYALVKLDAAGELMFSRSVRFGSEIEVYPTGDIIVAGRGLAMLDASGTELWSVNYDANTADLTLSPNGAVGIVGSALGPVDFGTGPLTYRGGNTDAFVATFNPPGSDDDGEGGDGAGSTGTGGGDPPATCTPGSVVACYTGPAGTRGVGPCAPGTQTCLPNGGAYGPCVGEVTPVAEVCATPEDENCDGEPHCPLQPPWARGYGDTGADVGWSIASDAAGNYYVTGSFEGTVDFGAGPLTSAGLTDVFLLKLDPSGALLWSKRFGDADAEAGGAVAVDGSGNVLLAGIDSNTYGSSGMNFGTCEPLPLPGDDTVFVAKLDPEGNLIWSRRSVLEQQISERFEQLAIDALGDVYVALFRGYEYWDQSGPVVAKLDSAGSLLWSEQLMTGPPHHVDDQHQRDNTLLAVDSAGFVFAASASISEFIPDDPYYPRAHRFTVQKLTPTGDVVWSRQLGPSDPADTDIGTSALALAVDADDELLLTAYTDGTVDFGGGVLPEGPVLIKLDAAGEHVFSQPIPFGDALALDPSGGIVIAGDGLSRLDPSGTALWTSSFDATANDIAVSPNGTIALTGAVERATDFGSGPIPYAAGTDVFVATMAH